MTRTRLYLIVLLLISILAFYLVNSQQSSTLTGDEKDFAVTPIDAVTQIDISGSNGYTTKIVQEQGNNWMVNNRYKARPDAVETLLGTLKRLKVKHLVSKTAMPNVKASFKKPVKTVKVYLNKESTPSKVFHIGNVTANKLATYMMLEGAENPYAVYMPGMEGQLHTRFFNLPEEWRDRMVFNLIPEQISKVMIDYVRTPKQSFELNMSNDSTATVQSSGTDAPKKANGKVVKTYLNGFENIYCEAFENDHPRIDSVKQSQPFCTMRVTDTAGNEKSLVIHNMLVNKRSKRQVDAEGNAVLYDSDRYLAFINKGRDLVLLQDFVFGQFFKKKEDFL
ncbi:MAG: DUF4340 domain-containing protein [Chitinophagales bacterium]